MMQHHAVLEREPALLLERRRDVRRDHPQAELDVADQPALRTDRDLGAVGELARLADPA